MKLEQAAQQALEALELHCPNFVPLVRTNTDDVRDNAITALREALAEPVKLAISKEAFNWIDANAPMFVRKALGKPELWYCDKCGKNHCQCPPWIESDYKPAEQTEQEPVAWVWLDDWLNDGYPEDCFSRVNHQNKTPLYAAPVQQAEQEPVAWVDLEQWQSGEYDCFTSEKVADYMTPLYAAPVRTKT